MIRLLYPNGAGFFYPKSGLVHPLWGSDLSRGGKNRPPGRRAPATGKKRRILDDAHRPPGCSHCALRPVECDIKHANAKLGPRIKLPGPEDPKEAPASSYPSQRTPKRRPYQATRARGPRRGDLQPKRRPHQATRARGPRRGDPGQRTPNLRFVFG